MDLKFEILQFRKNTKRSTIVQVKVDQNQEDELRLCNINSSMRVLDNTIGTDKFLVDIVDNGSLNV